MGRTLGYMITWTTFGTWLQGDNRRYVKNARTLPANQKLVESNRHLQLQDAVKLTDDQRQIVHRAILEEARQQGHRIYALVVQSCHVHIVAGYIHKPISKIVAYYKKAARVALQMSGHNGRVWTKGYDKRFCFDQETLEQKISYVNSHNK